MTSSGEGGSDLPSHRRSGKGLRPLPSQPRHDNGSTVDTGLPFEQWPTHQEGQWVQTHAWQPCAEPEAVQR
jgi:hypothetical protein